MKKLLLLVFFCTAFLFPQESTPLNVGRIISFKSDILNETRNISVFLPFGYAQSNNKYPVLYVFDGESHFLHAIGTSNFFSNYLLAPQMIVVSIPNTIRNRDYSPVKVEDLQNSGGGENFVTFLKDELIPYIDENFRTEKFRIVFGHSQTAMFSMYNLLMHPDLFDGYIAASPWVLYNNNYLAKQFSEKKLESFSKSKFLYFTLGNEPDYFTGIDQIKDVLTKNNNQNLIWKYQYHPEADHTTIPLKTLYEGLEFIFSGYSLDRNLLQTANIEKVKEHFNSISKRYGFNIQPSEAIINVYGYQMMQNGNMSGALELFKYNVELYPESANVYDSYGEGLETSGNLSEAASNYKKAVEIGEKNKDPNLEIFKEHFNKAKARM